MRAEIVGVSFAVEAGSRRVRAAGARLRRRAGATRSRRSCSKRLRPLLEDAQKEKLGQHLKYDMNVLSNYGIGVRGVRFDSMLESYVWNSSSNRHDMDTLAKKYLGVDTIHYEDVTGKGAKQIPFAQVDVQRAADYAAEDADITLRLHQRAVAEARIRAEAARGVRRYRNAARAGAGAHGTDRRADRRAETAHAEPGARPAHARTAATRIRDGRAAFQPRFAEAIAAAAVRRTEIAGDVQDADRPAVDERGSARGARRASTNCRA